MKVGGSVVGHLRANAGHASTKRWKLHGSQPRRIFHQVARPHAQNYAEANMEPLLEHWSFCLWLSQKRFFGFNTYGVLCCDIANSMPCHTTWQGVRFTTFPRAQIGLTTTKSYERDRRDGSPRVWQMGACRSTEGGVHRRTEQQCWGYPPGWRHTILSDWERPSAHCAASVSALVPVMCVHGG